MNVGSFVYQYPNEPKQTAKVRLLRPEPLHQLTNMPATDDKRAFDYLAEYFAGFFLALGILH